MAQLENNVGIRQNRRFIPSDATEPWAPDSVGYRVAKRFYESIILLMALTTAYKDAQPRRTIELSPHTIQSSELIFHQFVNKLAQFCDTGRTYEGVTAFVVLQFPDRIQYRFASNQQDAKSLARAQDLVTWVLRAIREACRDQPPLDTSHILRKVLSFTRIKVTVYIKSMQINLDQCMDACRREDSTKCELGNYLPSMEH